MPQNHKFLKQKIEFGHESAMTLLIIDNRHLHCIGESIGAYLHFSMHPSSTVPSSFMPPMQTRASTSQPTRMWGKLAEGELGKLECSRCQHLNVLVHRVGGLDELKKALKAIPEKVKADPAQLIDHLCEIFKLDDAERSVCVAAFWNTHGALAVEEETSVFGGLWDLHGTHMRSWHWWTYLLKHPDIERAFSGAPPVLCSGVRDVPRRDDDMRPCNVASYLQASAEDALAVGHCGRRPGASVGRRAPRALPRQCRRRYEQPYPRLQGWEEQPCCRVSDSATTTNSPRPPSTTLPITSTTGSRARGAHRGASSLSTARAGCYANSRRRGGATTSTTACQELRRRHARAAGRRGTGQWASGTP